MSHYVPQVDDIDAAAKLLAGVSAHTPLQFNARLSQRYRAHIYLKREDLQPIRSFKIRGAFNKIASLGDSARINGVVCASAGNHSQGVAYACARLSVKATIFMPQSTPSQKVRQTKSYGGEYVEVILGGKTFDDALLAANHFQQLNHCPLVHPFDDPKVIEGQGTVAPEILAEAEHGIDYLLAPLGGGGLVSGVFSYFRSKSTSTQLIAVEPAGAAAMKQSLKYGTNTTMDCIDVFSDGAAVKRVGERAFELCKHTQTRVLAIDEGRVCSHILELYNDDAIIAEPAGALSIAALDNLGDEIYGKQVVCVLSGGNNDIGRIEEIRARSLAYEGFDILCDGPPMYTH